MKNPDKTLRNSAYIIALFILTFLFFVECQKSYGQTLDSAWKIKRSTNYAVIVRTDSCTTYLTTWNSHCYRCFDVAIVPKKWKVKKVGEKYFIKADL